jgi:hypothetical protein
MLNYDVFEALKAAGVPEEKARRAAETISEASHAAEVADMRSDVIDLKTNAKVNTWILGLSAVMLAALLLRVFSPGLF